MDMNVREHLSNQGLDLRKQGDDHLANGRCDEALRCFTQILNSEPNHPHGLAGMAMAMLGSGRAEEALALARQVASSDNFHPPSLVKLGESLQAAHRHAKAIDVFTYAASRLPNVAAVWNYLGNAQLKAQAFSDAILSFRRAAALKPSSATPHDNMALALLGLDRLPEALAASRRALSLDPKSSVAQFNLSCILLAMGSLEEGWDRHRFRSEEGMPPVSPCARAWNGESLDGRRIVVLGEQANGDYIQFARYLVALAELGADVTATVPTRLHRLFSSLPCSITFQDHSSDGSGFDYFCRMFDLPHFLGLVGSDTRRPVPYLEAEPERVAHWRKRIGSHGFRIGVAWKGGRYNGDDFRRSFPLEALWPVTQVSGVRLISLQFRSGLDQIPGLPCGMQVEELGDSFEEGEHGFLDAAAVMRCCDLVISLDSALAHLAGALGCRTWIALNHAPDWRWQRERTDSPWYQTVRLFRQHQPRDWDGVFSRMADALRTETANSVPDMEPRLRAMPLAPMSCGEVLDKITILEIKAYKLGSPEAVADVGRELHQLREVAAIFGGFRSATDADVKRLRFVNDQLWNVEDALRICEAEQRFGEEFVALARSVYVLNDERAALKRAINTTLNSRLFEHKSYG